MTKLPLPNMMDSLDFVKKLWGSMGLPNAVTPTADLDELDKRIADLKAVEQWLQLNANLLRGTIQGLEVQRGTIATLKAFGTSFANMAMPSGSPASAFPAPPFPAPAAAAPGPAAAEPPSAPSPAPQPSGRSAPLSGMDAGLSPTAWWGMLSDQFMKIAQAAAASAATPGIGKPASKPTEDREETGKKGKTVAKKSPRESARAPARKESAGTAGPATKRRGGKTAGPGGEES